jgi:ADP-ribose pyrophosphatase YjhB (NUDIX family)
MVEVLKPEGQEYKVAPISKEPEAQAKRGWKLEINGKEFEEPIENARLFNSRMGVELKYGQRPEGYDGFVLTEPGGGGAVTIPYYVHEGNIYIGVVEEARPTCTDGATEMVMNVPRGFLTPGETHFETAKRALAEEAGYEPLEKRIVQLNGEPQNPNSTYFVTGKDKGVRMYGVQVHDFEVSMAKSSDDPSEREFQFDKEIIKPTSRMGERIGKSKFIHWKKAASQIDMFTAAGVARILATTQSSAK